MKVSLLVLSIIVSLVASFMMPSVVVRANSQNNHSTLPEISVEGNSVEIADEDNTPSVADHTDFGSAGIDTGTVVRTFTIKNTGSGQLTLNGTPMIAVGGTHAADFTVTANATTPVAASGGSTTFQVTFNPSATGFATTGRTYFV